MDRDVVVVADMDTAEMSVLVVEMRFREELASGFKVGCDKGKGRRASDRTCERRLVIGWAECRRPRPFTPPPKTPPNYSLTLHCPHHTPVYTDIALLYQG